MHWLLLLAVLSSTTSLNNGGSPSSLNRLAENALRQQLGSVSAVRVDVVPGRGNIRGDFDTFNVALDGFSADRLMGLAERAGSYDPRYDNRDDRYPTNDRYPPDDRYDDRYPADSRYPSDSDYPYYPPNNNYIRQGRNQFDPGDLGDILGGGLGGIFGDILGARSGGGRIGRINLRATNFTFQGARYDSLTADLGEVRFDWAKALRGDFDIKSLQPGTLGVRLQGDQAARLIAPRIPSVRDLRVRFANGQAFVGGRSDFYGVQVPFEVGGRLSVQANEVRADGISLSVARLRLPSFVIDELTRNINPLYDFDPQDRWPLAINLQTAGTDNNSLAMRGGIQWLGFNRSRQDRNRQPDYREPDYREPDYPRDDPNRDRRQPGDIWGDIFGR